MYSVHISLDYPQDYLMPSYEEYSVHISLVYPQDYLNQGYKVYSTLECILIYNTMFYLYFSLMVPWGTALVLYIPTSLNPECTHLIGELYLCNVYLVGEPGGQVKHGLSTRPQPPDERHIQHDLNHPPLPQPPDERHIQHDLNLDLNLQMNDTHNMI